MAADYRSVQTGMWREDEWFQTLELDARLFWIYLFTNPSASVAGIYRLPLRTMSFESGIPQKRVVELLQEFSKAGKAHFDNGVVWVRKMRDYQLPGKVSPQLQAHLLKEIAKIPQGYLKSEYLKVYGYPIDTVSILPLTETETDTDKETDKETETPQTPAGSGNDADDASSGSVILDLDFALVSNTYENNIGLLSPIIADSLKDDIKEFSASWVVEAIGIAVKAKKSDLRYVEGILKRWKREGKDRSRTNGRDNAPAAGSDELARGYDVPEGYEDLVNRPRTEPASPLPDLYTELLAEADRLRGSKDPRAITLLQRKLDNLLSTAQLPVSYDDALSALAQRLQEAVP